MCTVSLYDKQSHHRYFISKASCTIYLQTVKLLDICGRNMPVNIPLRHVCHLCKKSLQCKKVMGQPSKSRRTSIPASTLPHSMVAFFRGSTS